MVFYLFFTGVQDIKKDAGKHTLLFMGYMNITTSSDAQLNWLNLLIDQTKQSNPNGQEKGKKLLQPLATVYHGQFKITSVIGANSAIYDIPIH